MYDMSPNNELTGPAPREEREHTDSHKCLILLTGTELEWGKNQYLGGTEVETEVDWEQLRC